MRMFKSVFAAVSIAVASLCGGAQAKDLGVEGAIFMPIEEDFRLMMMRLFARVDWDEQTALLESSAKSYTANLPSYFLYRSTETKTVWKDVGILTTEDIYFPSVDHETGSVFEPQPTLAIEKGTYYNPISNMPSGAIERLFIFDATDEEQLALARALMVQDIPSLHFMLIAGDLGPLSEEMRRPIYHPSPQMLEKFHVTAVPALIGFGKGPHQGHMAITQFKLPASLDEVKGAWYGLPYPGYDPTAIVDFEPVETVRSASELHGSAPVSPTPKE